MASQGTVRTYQNRNSSDNEENSLAVAVIHEEPPLSSVHAPLVSSYNHRIRPLLDAVDRLRHLAVMKEGIQLPTIVVVGDQSSGKSSVLESLAGISLPRGQGICTRVPLIMRLKHHPTPQPELSLEFSDKIVPTDETHIAEAITKATDEIAGIGKGISDTPLTLVVKKNGVPDLTMVDLPGITRVPVHDQPKDIYEQISAIIMEYISPEASIILNVLSATVDFPTCESIRMSQRVDKTGGRTLAVVTKADKAPEGLLEKVAADDVNIGLGYVCVRNRIGDESYEEARKEEARLFATHPLLSKIDKSIVGIPVLAQKLVQIQATSIKKSLPEIVTKINDKLKSNVSELSKMPPILSSVAEAMTAFMRILGSSKESLRKILLRGEFDEYPDEEEMHCTARLAEKLIKYSDELQSNSLENDRKEDFLMEEIRVLEEAKGICLPNFLPRTAFRTILQRKVKGISQTPIEFVDKVWSYIEGVVISVLMHHSENYPQLQSSTRRATYNLIARIKLQSTDRVKEIVEMERLTDYTCNPEYMSKWKKLMARQDFNMEAVAYGAIPSAYRSPSKEVAASFGEAEVRHLRQYSRVEAVTSAETSQPSAYRQPRIEVKGFGETEVGHLRHQAFDLKMRMTAYWKIVLRRLVDCMALHLLHDIRNLVNKDMEMEIVNELMGPYSGGIERMLEESRSVAGKRESLNKSISLMKEAKDVVAKILDKIAIQGD